MNERIFELARQSGATDENGSRATTVYCFTDQELKGFAELIVAECVSQLNIPDVPGPISAGLNLGKIAIKQHFGVAE
jgi:hypothetical protein